MYRRLPRPPGIPLGAVSGASVPIGPLVGVIQAPITPTTVSPHGGYNYVRSTPADGACGVGTYPCVHPGSDVVGASGTPVHAPEDGQVVATADGAGAPFGGYGPWVVVLQGKSGWFHLLGHLDPIKAPLAPAGIVVKAGQILGTTSSANHVHWEVRRKAVPDFAKGESNKTNNIDPFDWLRQFGSPGTGWILLAAVAAVVLLVRRG
jgi:murein DD-endopeptidase MepM/ murein hydrolase activator NlpD